MRKSYIYITLLLAILFVGCSSSKDAAKQSKQTSNVEFKAASYNVRYAAKADEESGNGWDIRKGPVADLIKKYDFDIVGTQEANAKQWDDMKVLLPDYGSEGHPYGGSSGTNHNSIIFYKKQMFDVLDKGVFWLSQTPDEPSLGWDATDRRICYWIKFKEKKSGKEFFFFNAHFYWKFKIAKEQSGPLMVRKIKEIAGDSPVICTGDLNSGATSPQMKAMREFFSDAYDVTQTAKKGPLETNLGGGNFIGPPSGRIDYIYVSNHFKVLDYVTMDDTYNSGHYPSDHLPIASVVSLEK